MTNKVLVCGGREFDDWCSHKRKLDQIHEEFGIGQIIEGGAIGADFLARVWAKAHNVDFVEYQADWKTHGRAAGPIRNQQMLEEGKPDLVVAFPGGRGTADMVRKAHDAGVRTIQAT